MSTFDGQGADQRALRRSTAEFPMEVLTLNVDAAKVVTDLPMLADTPESTKESLSPTRRGMRIGTQPSPPASRACSFLEASPRCSVNLTGWALRTG